MLDIAAIQFNPLLLDLNGNRKKVTRLIRTCLSSYNSKLIVLPELAFSGYNFENIEQVEQTAEVIPHSESCALLEDFAIKDQVYIVAGINEREGTDFYNAAVVFGPTGYIKTYRKIQLYAREKEFFKPGNLPLQIFNIGDYRIGIMICFDWFFPEIPRSLALMGADVICHSMNAVIPDGAYLGDTYHARWNRVFIILANRIGSERSLEFIGRSVIIDPTGRLLAQASPDQEEIIQRSIDPSLARNKQLNSFNHVIDDRRTQMYKLD